MSNDSAVPFEIFSSRAPVHIIDNPNVLVRLRTFTPGQNQIERRWYDEFCYVQSGSGLCQYRLAPLFMKLWDLEISSGDTFVLPRGSDTEWIAESPMTIVSVIMPRPPGLTFPRLSAEGAERMPS